MGRFDADQPEQDLGTAFGSTPEDFDTFEAFRPVEELVHETLARWPESEHKEFAFKLTALSARINAEVGFELPPDS